MKQTENQLPIMAITFLRHIQDRKLPKWIKPMPKKWQEYYTLHHQPFLQQDTAYGTEICMQIDKIGYFSPLWREETKKALEQGKEQGAIVALSSMAEDLPKGILPFAKGQQLTALFAMEGAALALERMGKKKEDARYVIADGAFSPVLLDCLPLWVNHLGIMTDRPACYLPYQEHFLSEQGLSMEIFSSMGNPAFRNADAVLSFSQNGKGMVYAMQDNSFFLELAGNHRLLRHFAETRGEVVTADGFFFEWKKEDCPPMLAEAYAFCLCPAFRHFFLENRDAKAAKEALLALGFSPCGFSIEEKRRKILRRESKFPSSFL